jgi:hypothetical protein
MTVLALIPAGGVDPTRSAGGVDPMAAPTRITVPTR